MERYAFHIAFACLLGLCRGDDEGLTTPESQCGRPLEARVQLEERYARPICNNATYEWLLNSVLAEVTKQNELATTATQKVKELTEELEEKSERLMDLEKGMRDKDRQLSKVKHQVRELMQLNGNLEARLGDADEMRAKKYPQPKDCADVQRYGFHYSGIYTVYPQGRPGGLEVFCDLQTAGGGWLVLHRRQDGSQSFQLPWEDYKHGFGTLAKEFWLGNDNMHLLTHQRNYRLRVDMTTYDAMTHYATYNEFTVADEEDLYRLEVDGYKGSAGDSLVPHNDAPFSTADRDHDQSRSGNCAELHGGGGWWFVRCCDSNLNGVYSDVHRKDTVLWFSLSSSDEPLRHAEMKIRPVDFRHAHDGKQ